MMMNQDDEFRQITQWNRSQLFIVKQFFFNRADLQPCYV